MRIAVRAPNWVGDAVMSLPAMADLTRSFPEAEIHGYAAPPAAEIYARAGLGIHTHPLPAGGGRGRLMRELVPEIRRGRYDVGLVLPPSFSSALVFRLGAVPTRVGYRGEARSALLTVAVPRVPRGEVHLSEEYRRLVEVAATHQGLPFHPAHSVPALTAHPDERARAEALLADGPSPRVVLAPGAVFGPTKRWPASSFADLADRLADGGASVILTGAPADADACREVADRARHPLRDLCGRTDLGTLIALFQATDLVVSNDSGAMHVAAASGTPTVAIFGSTSPEWTAPVGKGVTVVRHREPCAPCFRPDCDIGIVCLTRLGVDSVHEACRVALEVVS